jgi:hypothetical protein
MDVEKLVLGISQDTKIGFGGVQVSGVLYNYFWGILTFGSKFEAITVITLIT